jgi:ATP-dependent RNA helicase RhlB
LLKTLFKKIKNLFRRKKSGAIPFAERSREAVKDIPLQEGKDSRSFKNQSRPRREVRKEDRKETTDKQERQPRVRQERERPPRQPAWNPDEFQVPKVEGKVRFHDLDLPPQILHAIADLNFQYCTPVQAGILPDALTGKDAIGKAQTGTGKSAAFIITILTRMIRKPLKGGPPKGSPRALILAPTRELVLQIEKDALGLSKYTPFKVISIYGGTGYERQMQNLKDRSYDIIVATPGRLIDFQNKRLIKLDKVEILVLDEADRMLDMGFIPDVRKIIYSTPQKSQRQTFFYSATFTPEVTRLAEQWTTDPCMVEIEPDQVASESVKQVVYITTSHEKFPLLYNLIISNNLEKVLVFTNRRDQARDLAKKLLSYGISTSLISGEVQQNKRIKALEGFRGGKCRVLVATDVAARGIHIDDISHVINYNLPQDAENYVHRIGRTGRAGSSGISVSFACEDDSFHIPDIEAFLGNDLVCEHPDDALLAAPPEPVDDPEELDAKAEPSRPRSRTRSGGGRGGQGTRNNRHGSQPRNRTHEKPGERHGEGSSEKPAETGGENKDKPKRNRNRNRRRKPPHRDLPADES